MRVRTGIIRAGAAAVMVASVIAVRTPAADADTVTHADAITDLGIDDFGSMVVDEARNQVIISGGTGDAHLTFVDLDGNVTGAIGGLDGPSGMVIVGSTLYVFEHSTGQITPVDLTTKTFGAALASGLSGGYMLGYAGGYLWTSTGEGLDRIDPSNGAVTTFTGAAYPTGASIVDFATDPSDPSRLAVVAEATDTTLRIYDASADPPAKLAGTKLSAYGMPRFTPDGASIVVSTGTEMAQLSATDLSLEHTYPGIQPYGITFVWGVDTVHRGGVTYLAELTTYGTTVFAEMDDTPVLSTYVTPFVAMTRGIRIAPSGDRLFAVSHFSTGEMQLFTFDDPTLFGSSMTISARERVPVFRKIRLSGQLSFDEGTPVPAGVPVEIWQRFGGVDQLVTTVTTAAGGAWSAEYPTGASDVGGAHDFSARFGGDAEHRGSTAEASVIVGRIKPDLTLVASRHSILLGEHVRITVTLGLDHHDGPRAVRIMRDQKGHRRLIGIVTVNDNGVGWLRDAPTRDATYEAIVLRDTTHSRSVSNLEHVKVLAS
jgi:hypothetical protein